MAKIILVSAANSFTLNGIEYQKGSLSVNHSIDGVSIGGTYADLADITINGSVPASIAALKTWISANCFKSGGGSGTGAVNSVTGDLVDNTDPANPVVNTPVESIGYLNLSNGSTFSLSSSVDVSKVLSSSSPSGLTNITINFPQLTDRVKKRVIIFLVDVAGITIVPQGSSTVTNVPTRAKKGDCWTVIYDSNDFAWDLVSINSMPKWYIDERTPSGTDRDIRTWDSNGNPVSAPIAIKQLTNIEGFPSFANGILAATAMNSVDETGFLSFIEFSITPRPGAFPVYNSGGVLPVADAIEDGDAANLKQLKSISAYDFIIEKVGSLVYARAGSGRVGASNASATFILNYAMNALTTGGNILIKGALDNIDILTVPYNNIVIRGQGRYNTILKLKANADSFYNPAARVLKGMFQVHGINGFEIHDMSLDGNGQNQTWINNGTQIDGPGCLSGVYVGNQFESVNKSNNTIIENVHVHDFTMYGFYTQANSVGTKIRNSSAIDCYWNGVTLLGTNDFIQNLDTHGSGDVGISIYGQRTTLINCNVGAQNGAYSSVASRWGIAIEQSATTSKDHRIIDCTIDGGVGFDIFRGLGIQKAEDVIIQNLKVRNSKQFGAYIEGCIDVNIINSDFKSTHSADFTQGVVITDLGAQKSSNIKVLSSIVSFTGFSVNVTSGSNKSILMNNILSKNVEDAGVDTVKTNNITI